MLTALYFSGLALNAGLWGSEWLRILPAKVSCDCSFFRIRPHWDNAGMFVQFLASAYMELITTLMSHEDMGWLVVVALWCLLTSVSFLLWWKHSKNKRKKLKDKVLGFVKVTVAGLKVVPVPAGGAAMLALLGALTACGADASSAPEGPAPSTISETEQWSYVIVPTQDGLSVPCVKYTPHATAPSISCDFSKEYKR